MSVRDLATFLDASIGHTIYGGSDLPHMSLFLTCKQQHKVTTTYMCVYCEIRG